jgi:DNA-binding response OmpR family regulator
MRVLFLANNTQENNDLSLALEVEGFVVDSPRPPAMSFMINGAFEYDMAVLDLCSLAREGVEIVLGIRSLSRQASILVLGASTSLETKLRYFELGIDDFLPKPVVKAEFIARARASVRHLSDAQLDTLKVSGLRLNRLDRRVFWKNHEIKLQKKEYLLLEGLMLRAERVVSREAVMEEVWRTKYADGGNAVDVCIRRLRQKIEEPYGQKLIRTIRGYGYSIRADRRPPA